jgi:regulator of cell morphogenesis and NO signaling
MDSTTFRHQVLKRYRYDLPFKMGVQAPDGFDTETEQEFISVLTRAFEEEVGFRYSEFNSFPMEILVDYIRRTHHLYLNKTLNEIEQSISILNDAYPVGHELLDILNDFYLDYKHDLIRHIREEDELLLPYVNYLNSLQHGFDQYDFFITSSSFKIEQFFDDHEEHDSQLENIREKILSYQPPETNRFVYGILLQQFSLFEQDLKIHGMIEEQVLIPRALEMERRALKLFHSIARLN